MCCYLLQLLKQEFGTVCHCILNLIWNRVPLHLRCGGVSAGGPIYICSLRQSAVCLYFFLARLAKKYIARPPELVRKNPRKIELRTRWHCRFPIVRRRVPLSLRHGTITRVSLHLRCKFWLCVATSARLGYIVCHSASKKAYFTLLLITIQNQRRHAATCISCWEGRRPAAAA